MKNKKLAKELNIKITDNKFKAQEEVKQSIINNKINNIKQIIITLGLQKVEMIIY